MDEVLLSKRMRKLRLENNYTIAKVAKAIGLTASYYGECERGRRKLSVDKRLKLAELYDVGIEYFTQVNYVPKEIDLSAIDYFPQFVHELPMEKQKKINKILETFMELF